MNHFFTYGYDGKEVHFIYDIESGSLLNVDTAAFTVAKNRYSFALTPDELEVFNNLSQAEREEISAELDGLENDGVLNSVNQENSAELVPSTGIVKAMCLHICHDCNMRCAYCFADEGTYRAAKREYMSLETGKSAVDFLIANSGTRKNLEIDFFGGEPLLNFDTVKKIVSYAREQEQKSGKKFSFTTTTNCLLLDKEKADWLNAEMENVVLSLDGRKEINDAVRKSPSGKSTFDTVLKNARYFASVRGDRPYYVRGTFTAKNLDFTEDVKFIHAQGFKQISVEPVVTDIKELELTEAHMPAILSEYERLAEYVTEQKTRGGWFNFFHFMTDLENGPCLKKRVSGCGSGMEYLSVLPDGDIYPCHRFAGAEGYLMGNVNKNDFSRKVSGEFEKCNVFSKPECENCFAKYHCSGGCAANNFDFSGNINKPYAASCEMMKKRFELALCVSAFESYLE